MKEVSAKINSMKNILSNVKTASDAAIDFYNNGADVYNTIIEAKGLQKKKMIPVPRNGKKNKKKDDGD